MEDDSDSDEETVDPPITKYYEKLPMDLQYLLNFRTLAGEPPKPAPPAAAPPPVIIEDDEEFRRCRVNYYYFFILILCQYFFS